MNAPSGALIAAFVLLILSFFGATGYSFRVSGGIRQASESIASDTTPSVLRLVSARTELRRLQLHVQRLLARDHLDPIEGRAVDRSLRALEEELRSYTVLPLTPGEEGYAREIAARHAELREAISEVLGPAAVDRPGAREHAELRVWPLVDRLDDEMKGAADLNGQHAQDQAMEILRLRHTGKRAALWLDVLCAGFGVLLLAMVVSSLRRYTRLLEAQKAQLEARANELDDFSARVAHDIRGPLSALGLALQLASRSATDEATRSMVARGQRSLKRAADIIDGLYEFARSAAKPMSDARCDPATVLADLVDELRPLAEEAGIELRLELSTRSWVCCSVGVLSSIAGNLARNAIKYMGGGPERRVTLRLRDSETTIRLEVEDTGPGLPPELRRVIFEPHARAPGTNQPGLGLGLATVRRLAEAHGGAVDVDSEVGRGSRFWVELPCTSAPQG